MKWQLGEKEEFMTSIIYGQRYRVISKIGQGGMATVYKAHDPLLDREVALKVPRRADGGAVDNLFLHEAKAAARLPRVSTTSRTAAPTLCSSRSRRRSRTPPSGV